MSEMLPQPTTPTRRGIFAMTPVPLFHQGGHVAGEHEVVPRICERRLRPGPAGDVAMEGAPFGDEGIVPRREHAVDRHAGGGCGADGGHARRLVADIGRVVVDADYLPGRVDLEMRVEMRDA